MINKPKKKYKPQDWMVVCADGKSKFVSDLTLKQLQQQLCRELDFTQSVNERLAEIQEQAKLFGWEV